MGASRKRRTRIQNQELNEPFIYFAQNGKFVCAECAVHMNDTEEVAIHVQEIHDIVLDKETEFKLASALLKSGTPFTISKSDPIWSWKI